MKQEKISLERYNSLSVKGQGYASYMQGAWNKDIPDKCPYSEDSKEHKLWYEGQFVALLEVQDGEE